jgi:peptidoglycan hydrolase-like protein with peptidoglycan-binding domain
MFKKALIFGIGTVLLAAPLAASALTIADLQAQIQSILAQIQSLGGSSSASVSGSAVASPVMPPCLSLSRSLSIGAQGSDVTSLQSFLSSQGYLSVSPTGYFGPLTAAAVGRWQAQNGVAASGSAGYGIFGPLSRSYLQRSCGSTTTGTTGSTGSIGSITTTGTGFSASPASGTAPLTVQFTSSEPQGSSIGTTVNFGDGTSGTLGVIPVCSSCNAMGSVSHTYLSAGTYTATLTGGSCACPVNGICNCPNMQILGTATVTVNADSASSSNSTIQQLSAPGSVSLQQGGIAEVRNENYYFTLESLSSSAATIQLTPVGCWNSFPSDTPPAVRCMIAVMPIAPQTLSIGQSYASGNYSITLTQITNGVATFSIGVAA